MEEEKPTEAPAPAAPAKGKGLWIGIVVVVIVIVVLLAAVFAGLFGAPTEEQSPEAVFFVAFPDDALKYIPAIDANRVNWPAALFFSEGIKDAQMITDLLTAGVDVSEIVGTAPVPSGDPIVAAAVSLYENAYTARFGDLTIGLFSGASYDATFVLALAMAKSNTTDASTAAFKQAMRDVSNPPGTVIRPGEWQEALNALAAGQDIQYVGGSGSVNFDDAGEVSSDYEVWGVDANNQLVQKLFIAEGSWRVSQPAAETRGDDRPRPLQLSPKIGTILPLTGGLDIFGPDMQNGTILAGEQVNAQGGIWGANLGLFHEDSGSDATVGSNAASKLITIDGVQAIVGAAASGVSQPVYEVVKPAGVLQISPASTSPVFTTLDDVDLFWRTAPPDSLQGAAAALYAFRDAGWRAMAIFHQNDAYGVGLADVFAAEFKARGGLITQQISYERGRPSYDTELESVFTPGAQPAPPIGPVAPARVSRLDR